MEKESLDLLKEKKINEIKFSTIKSLFTELKPKGIVVEICNNLFWFSDVLSGFNAILDKTNISIDVADITAEHVLKKMLEETLGVLRPFVIKEDMSITENIATAEIITNNRHYSFKLYNGVITGYSIENYL